MKVVSVIEATNPSKPAKYMRIGEVGYREHTSTLIHRILNNTWIELNGITAWYKPPDFNVRVLPPGTTITLEVTA